MPVSLREWDRWEGFTLIRRMITTDTVRKSLEHVKLPQADVYCPKRFRQLVLEEGRVNKCVIREVMALSHPARWSTPPHKACYALVAERKLQRGAPPLEHARERAYV